jgi:predicted PurR-regulated permease PerM
LQVTALLATVVIVWLAQPVGIGVLLGTLTAFTLFPLYAKLSARWRRPALASLVCVGATTVGGIGVLAGLGYLLIGHGIGLMRTAGTLLQPGSPARHLLEHLNARLPRLGVRPDFIAQRLGEAATAISIRLAAIAQAVASTTMSGLLALFFLVITCDYLLQNWNSLARRAELMLPLKPRDTRSLFEEFRRTGRTILLGTVLTGVAQGILAGLGYLVTRVPEPAFFAVLTALASLVPIVGTPLVWVPLSIYLLLNGHVVLGIIGLLYGSAVVVGFCDYILRPRLIGRSDEVPTLLTLIALFGGIEAFGLIGLILGPVVMSLALAILRIYERESRNLHAANGSPESQTPT